MGNTVSKTSKNKPKKKKKALGRFLIFLFLVALTGVCFMLSYNYVIKSQIEDSKDKEIIIAPNDEIRFVVPKGANTTSIASLLLEQGLIKNADIFKLLSKFNGYDGAYQSGTHIVSKHLSYDEMMRVLTSKPASHKVTIPEGKTFKQIVDILYSKNIISNKESFIKTANEGTFDYEFLKGLPARANKLEGYLFPDTYEFDLNASDTEIISRMLDNFQLKFKPVYVERIKAIKGMTMDKIIILASIIEKEAKMADERYTISGVLYNRLNNKDKTLRRLQVDATIQYILLNKTGEYKDRLLFEDLEIDDPYNTYKNEGLPPGPICCPGEAAIKAALYPEETSYLYYVSIGDGYHKFSNTFKEHQAAVKKYGTK